jgi:hypothetical protein
VAAEDFRVEIDLDDEEYGFTLWERFRALHVGDEVRRRLGDRVLVTRDGSQLFLYAPTERRAREVRKVAQEVIDADALSAETRITRWHPVEEEWENISVPLPKTREEERDEYDERVEAELEEVQEEGEFDWLVAAHVPSRHEASALAERLEQEGLWVAHRWRYVVVGALTEEDAHALAERLRRESPDGTDVSIEATVNDVPAGPFQFIGF